MDSKSLYVVIAVENTDIVEDIEMSVGEVPSSC